MSGLARLVGLAAVCQIACGPWNNQVFTTRCGLRFLGDGKTDEFEDFTLENIQRVEGMAVDAELVRCGSIDGYSMLVQPNGNWRELGEKTWRSGSSYCNEMFPRVIVAAPFFGLDGNSLAHELHHVEQRCRRTHPTDPGQDPAHGDWDRSGAYAKIREIGTRIEAWGRSLGKPPTGKWDTENFVVAMCDSAEGGIQ